jgi:hypothetical protein
VRPVKTTLMVLYWNSFLDCCVGFSKPPSRRLNLAESRPTLRIQTTKACCFGIPPSPPMAQTMFGGQSRSKRVLNPPLTLIQCEP